TRWKAETSSFDGIGVSTGTSYISTPHATVIAASAPMAAATSPDRDRLLLVFGLGRAVIDFLEQIVVLTNLRVVRLYRQGFLVRLACLVELALVLVSNAEVVVRRGVHRI